MIMDTYRAHEDLNNLGETLPGLLAAGKLSITPEVISLWELWGGVAAWRIGDDIFVVQPLMFHFALLVNPQSVSGYEHRYCYPHISMITDALKEYADAGETDYRKLRYWNKDHTRNLTVKGKYLYPQGVPQEGPEFSVGEVDWEIP